ncbi:hypothetical protein M408DRAFT_282581 [Serendipita vermifera MAFF 305830]|uniref:Nitrogen permease regulator 2 n=1 Tax=Serendipita vermifera MAFF 305830 TaxID=933852 RepID=A0A0C3ARK3_SERVB|nr:hypothetical protein M408DRAFT_282581 [Serendipita vermifera MAFF 305830]
MHISSVFFAIFDENQGPRIVYQVPENLITTPPPRTRAETIIAASTQPNGSDPSAKGEDVPQENGIHDAADDVRPGPKQNSLSKSTASKISTSYANNNPQSSSVNARSALFEWQLVSQFVIPRPDICGRLTVSTTKKHRIVGYPVIIRDNDRYERGTFQFNVCFVFAKDMDYGKEAGISCYEPIVRKIARVLTASEIDQSFLSSEKTQPRMYPILEQLFADLNSFSETSIRIDEYNSLELRIFPHYPNPPPVNAWDVPVPLIDIANRMEVNWDLTMRKVVPFINGIDHVKKIAQKAEADITLVKECMSQVMMYQCVVMTDIFQFSNIYTLCRPTMWLFTDPAVTEECGPYVHKGTGSPLPWPRLAWLYARLKPPMTVGTWISDYEVDVERIDVRRFISFGVIKGFLRRVHHWPILLKDDSKPYVAASTSKQRNKSMTLPLQLHSNRLIEREATIQTRHSSTPSDPPPGLGSSAPALETPQETLEPPSMSRPITSPSAAPNDNVRAISGIGSYFASSSIPREPIEKEPKVMPKTNGTGPGLTSSSYVPPSVLKSRMGMGMSSYDSTGNEEEDPHAVSLPIAQELAGQAYTQGQAVAKMKGVSGNGGLTVEVPPELSELLDGTHHSDELCVHFGQSWNVLSATLGVIGGGTGDDGDLGRVVILYR